MNIFATDDDPVIAAQNLCDQHVNKMLVESAQMLANAFTLDQLQHSDCPRSQQGNSRKHAYSTHPCTLWTLQSRGNMEWLCAHALAMEAERHYRWEGKLPHFSLRFVQWCCDHLDESIVPLGKRTPFALAIAETMQCHTVAGFDALDPIAKYRLYYKMDKPFAVWTKRKIPDWYL